MKKVVLVGIVAFFGSMAMTSCKKDHTCYCSASYSYSIPNQTKKKAKDICEENVQVGLVTLSGGSGCYLQ